ncbi:helix-turn-helix domain-containing protein [Alsobacter sp. R-9]
MNAAELIRQRKLLKAKFWTNPPRPVADPEPIKPSCVVVPIDREAMMAAMLPRRPEPIRVAADAAFMDIKVEKTRSRLILEEVAEKHGLRVRDMQSASRLRHLVNARQEASYRLRHECGLSLPAIGRLLGGRDHTTILWAVKRHAAAIAEGAGQ